MRNAVRAAALVASIALAGVPVTASAHGDEAVGDHVFVVGFETEPAFAGQPNAVEVTVSHHDGDPVTDIAAGQLQVEVSLGDQATTFPLEPAFEVGEWGTPGVYTAAFIPTEPGAYTFHLTGDLEGEPVDLEMTASPETFSEVQDPAEASFPATQGPTGDDLTSAVEAATSRADEAKTSAEAATAAIAGAKDTASTAQTAAIVGLIAGLAALVVAVIALIASRRPRT